MNKYTEHIEDHISTHTIRSAEDQAAVSTLEYFLRSDGRINTNFSSVDKWPNHDGTFEYVSNPDISRRPQKVFSVQIKGTHSDTENDGVITYSLKSLAFPAFIAQRVTADPGILFIVLNPDVRGKERVFWKYLSPAFIKQIDFRKNSTTIKLTSDDEIKNTDKGIDLFCSKLEQIVENYLFLEKLDRNCIKKADALEIAKNRCEDISSCIEMIGDDKTRREFYSKKIVTSLTDLCYAVLILNAVKQGYEEASEDLAWEVSLFDAQTRYLSSFLLGLKYIGRRIPEDGQSARLMLKYYGYLWEIRRFLRENYEVLLLENLEDFPLDLDSLDKEFYKLVADAIARANHKKWNVRLLRYYVHSITPFFVDGKRYFEITLRLAGMNASKHNRITVYGEECISTDYSVHIAYSEEIINLWGVDCKIKVLNNWKVSIDPACMNKLGTILKMQTKISSKYGEYNSLMDFLTRTGISLLDLISLRKNRFDEVMDEIYGNKNTNYFGEILKELRNNFSYDSNEMGRHTIRYVLLSMKEELLEAVMVNQYNPRNLNAKTLLSSRCYPFEKNPFVSDLVGTKSSQNDLGKIFKIVNNKAEVERISPYIKLEKLIRDTGELFFDSSAIANREAIVNYNNSLDPWEMRNGYFIRENDGMLSIADYEDTTMFILRRLLKLSKLGEDEQKKDNERYLRDHEFNDVIKRVAIEHVFVNSHVVLVYGSAGTGKTTFMNHVSDLMNSSTKLFMAKTHAALKNLERRIESKGDNTVFASIDSVVKSSYELDYDMIFVDECSTIDNRTMMLLLGKIKDETKLVLSGDIYQIESIEFGNWFYYAKSIIKTRGSNVELLCTWRTEDENLKSLWQEVREKKPIIVEKLVMDGPFSKELGEDVFSSDEDEKDEIVLCLNYDGKFGLNNMNQYFQNANKQSQDITWEEWTYKIGDPVLFIDTRRFPILYNNLRGRIVDIEKTDSKILFTIDVKMELSSEQCENEDFKFIESVGGETRILIEVIKWSDDLEEDDKKRTVIPFQIAYAVSIHKAQGLEYKSVKVVIPPNNAEEITHSIFYTAITRAKEKLKIYWSDETMDKIIKGFSDEKESPSLRIIQKRLE